MCANIFGKCGNLSLLIHMYRIWREQKKKKGDRERERRGRERRGSERKEKGEIEREEEGRGERRGR